MLPRAKKLRSVFLVGFLLTIALALTGYLDSSFLGTFVDIRSVGLLFSIGSLASIAFLAALPKLLPRIGLSGVFQLTTFLYLLSVLGMVKTAYPFVFQILFIVYIASGIGIYFAIDLLLEHFAKSRSEGRIRGIYLSVYNLAYLLGPLMAGLLLKRGSFELVYLLAGMFIIIMFVIYLRGLRGITFESHHKGLSFLKNIDRLLYDRNLRNAVICTFSLSFFFSMMAIYTPIYLNQFVGLDWRQIGIVFSLMHIPYVALEPMLGKIADQFCCERELLTAGLIITGVFTIILGFITSGDLFVWAGALALTRVGASFVQVAGESYFFKKIRPDDADMIALYRNSSPLAYIIGPAVATVILSFTSYPHLFIILGLLMIAVIVFSLRIRNTPSC